jgi:hypothetical protein
VKRRSPVRVHLRVSEFCMRSGCRENKVLLIPTVLIMLCPSSLPTLSSQRYFLGVCGRAVIVRVVRCKTFFLLAFSRFKSFPRSENTHELALRPSS